MPRGMDKLRPVSVWGDAHYGLLITSGRGGEIRYVSCLEWRSPLSCNCGTCTWGKIARDGNGEGRTNPLLSLQALIALPYTLNISPGTMEAQGLSKVLC